MAAKSNWSTVFYYLYGLASGLSPFLCTLVADFLSQIIINAESKRLIKGFLVGNDITNVSHHQYTDDTLILMDEDPKYVRILKLLIQCFGLVSGSKINLLKEAISWESRYPTSIVSKCYVIGMLSQRLAFRVVGFAVRGIAKK